MKKIIKNILRFFRNILVNIFRIFPLRNAILFESFPDFTDNVYWWCNYLEKKGIENKYKLYWIVKDHTITKAPNGWNIKLIYLDPKNPIEFIKKYYVIFTVKFIFDGCVFVNKRRKKQVRMYLHHGTPIKRIDTYFDPFKGYDGIEIQSDWFAPFFMEYGLDPAKFTTFGLVRNDQLKSNVGFLRSNGYARPDEKIIIWLPTFRQRKDHTSMNAIAFDGSFYGLPIIKTPEDMKVVNNHLKEKKVIIIIKPHPSQDMSCFNVDDLSNIKVITSPEMAQKNVQLYDILGETDGMLSDYSSVYFDYLLTDKPIGLTCDDIVVYRNKTGFSFDNYKDTTFEGNIKGTYIYKVEDFLKFIDQVDSGYVSDEQKEAKYTFNHYVDFKSGDRLYNYMKEKYDL